MNSELQHSPRATRGNLTVIRIWGGEFELFMAWVRNFNQNTSFNLFKNRESLKVKSSLSRANSLKGKVCKVLFLKHGK